MNHINQPNGSHKTHLYILNLVQKRCIKSYSINPGMHKCHITLFHLLDLLGVVIKVLEAGAFKEVFIKSQMQQHTRNVRASY